MASIIGLTGQTGAGKSYVREMFWEKGAAVIDADSVSHDITENNIDCIYDIVNHFSCAVLNEKGTINRKALGRRVFSDKKELLALNRLIFPYIREAIDAEVERYKAEGKEAIDKEFERILPVIRQGGFIPGADHQVAPSTSLENYKYYIEKLNEAMTHCGEDL